MNNGFHKIYPVKLAQTIDKLVAASQKADIEAQVITLQSDGKADAGDAAVVVNVELRDVPVGYVFKLIAGSLNAGGVGANSEVKVTLAGGQAFFMDPAETISLMRVPQTQSSGDGLSADRYAVMDADGEFVAFADSTANTATD